MKLFKTYCSPKSKPPSTAANAPLMPITAIVERMVSARVGQATFLSSVLDSWRKVMKRVNIAEIDERQKTNDESHKLIMLL